MDKMDNPLISVIVPVYKVEPYLRRCLDSIVRQTYPNLEVILVDDGSPDNCGVICDDYAAADQRFTVFHKENGGVADARNYGTGFAAGEYVTFIDADDYVAPDYVEYLHQLLIATAADIACCDYLKTDGSDSIFLQSDEKTVLTGPKACVQVIKRDIAMIVSWGKLFPIELVKRYPFPKGKYNEDEFTTYHYYYESNRIAFGNAKLYAYYQNESGFMSTAIKNGCPTSMKLFLSDRSSLKRRGRRLWRRHPGVITEGN